jgi:hypothetical protein
LWLQDFEEQVLQTLDWQWAQMANNWMLETTFEG